MSYNVFITNRRGKVLYSEHFYSENELGICCVAARTAVRLNGYNVDEYDWHSLQFDIYEKKTIGGYKFDKVIIYVEYEHEWSRSALPLLSWWAR